MEEVGLEEVVVDAAIGSGADGFGTAAGAMKLAIALVVEPANALSGTKALGGSQGNALLPLAITSRPRRIQSPNIGRKAYERTRSHGCTIWSTFCFVAFAGGYFAFPTGLPVLGWIR